MPVRKPLFRAFGQVHLHQCSPGYRKTIVDEIHIEKVKKERFKTVLYKTDSDRYVHR